MQQPITLKPQDIALLIKLLLKKDCEWRQVDLAMELGISQGEIAKSLKRLVKAHLVDDKRANQTASIEFLIHGFKYCFPVEHGPLAVGVPTAISAPVHKKMVVQNDDEIFVWPHSKGNKRGQLIIPLYPQLAEAALKDQDFYDLMATLEIIRCGRARERKLAEVFLIKRIKVA
jgi:hypothetical protein